MRILTIPSPFPFVNPTYEYFIDELSKRPDVFIVGPVTKIPCNSIESLSKKYGKFHIILCDPWFFFQTGNLPEIYRPRDLFTYEAKIILSLMQYDLHKLSEKFIMFAKKNTDYIINAALSKQFYFRLNKDITRKEKWIDLNSYTVEDSNWIDNKFILLPHCIGEKEFIIKNKYKIDISIPGVDYYFRRKAEEYLEKNKIKYTTGRDLLQIILGKLSSIYLFGNKISKINQPIGIRLYRKRFATTITKSLISITCDGSIGYPVRKFFEIPAYGAILAAKFFKNPEALGFRDGENCFFLEEDRLGRIGELLHFLKSDSTEADRIARAGQEMVREFHAVEKRVDQFIEIAGAIADGTLKATRWEAGRQRLIRKQ